MTNVYDVGRGSTATADMKQRLAACKASGADWLDHLWERNWQAVVEGAGYTYEYAPKTEAAEPV